MTNKEFLYTLTPEELLKYVYIRCVSVIEGECPAGLTCKECQLKWLNAEHKEDVPNVF